MSYNTLEIAFEKFFNKYKITKKEIIAMEQLTQKFEIVKFNELREGIADNFEGLTPQFVRVKVPSGDLAVFEVDDEPAKSVEGIIVDHFASRVLYLKKYGEGDKTPPICRSNDGIYGERVGTDTKIPCANCEYNVWGSYHKFIDEKETSNRKACQEKHLLFLLRSGELLPLLFSLPSTSISPLAMYMTKLGMKGKNQTSVVTRISLEKDKSKGGIEYVKTVFQRVTDIPKENLDEIKEVVKFLKSYCRMKPIVTEEEETDGDVPF